MLAKGKSWEEIIEFTELSKEEIEKLKNEDSIYKKYLEFIEKL